MGNVDIRTIPIETGYLKKKKKKDPSMVVSFKVSCKWCLANAAVAFKFGSFKEDAEHQAAHFKWLNCGQKSVAEKMVPCLQLCCEGSFSFDLKPDLINITSPKNALFQQNGPIPSKFQ